MQETKFCSNCRLIIADFTVYPVAYSLRPKKCVGGTKRMKIDSNKFGKAVAIAVAILWTLYNIAVFWLMLLAFNLSGDFAYTDLTSYDWQPPLVKFILFLYILSLSAMFIGKLTAEIYNFLVEKSDIK